MPDPRKYKNIESSPRIQIKTASVVFFSFAPDDVVFVLSIFRIFCQAKERGKQKKELFRVFLFLSRLV